MTASLTFPTLAVRCSKQEAPPADPAPTVTQGVLLSIPDLSYRLLWRVVRLFRDVTFLTRLPENDRGGAWAGNDWFTRKYQCSEATVRRWLKLLQEHGWIRVELRGPNRLITPLVLPETILSFLPRFKRLLRGVLSGSEAGVPISPDRERSSNNGAASVAGRKAAKPAPPLPAEDAAVVAQAANAGVSRDCAEALVRKHGRQPVLDAVEVTYWRKKRGLDIGEPGGYIRRLAENLAAGLWKLPAKLLAARDAAERKAERDRAAANRVVSAPVAAVYVEPEELHGSPQSSGVCEPASTADTLVCPAEPCRELTPNFGSLSDTEWDALLKEALPLALREAAPVLRPLIEKRGIEHATVQQRARQLRAERGRS